MSQGKLNIFHYKNYRDFLSDYYRYKKSEKSTFSYRAFSIKAGIGSPSHLKMVSEGNRNLSLHSIPKFASAIGFNEKEKRYFELLVQFNQSADPETKAKHYSQLLRLNSGKEIKTLQKEKFAFLKDLTWSPSM